MSNRVGQQLGQYQLIRLLGQGGFAEVYLGEHVMLRTQAAIKVLYCFTMGMICYCAVQ
jgi:serine/threonine protein kinase